MLYCIWLCFSSSLFLLVTHIQCFPSLISSQYFSLIFFPEVIPRVSPVLLSVYCFYFTLCSSSLPLTDSSLLPQTSSDDCDLHEGIHQGREGKYRLQVTQFVQRLEFWHRELTNTLLTSITVAPVHGRTVAFLGTADGRHLQVTDTANNIASSQRRTSHRAQ